MSLTYKSLCLFLAKIPNEYLLTSLLLLIKQVSQFLICYYKVISQLLLQIISLYNSNLDFLWYLYLHIFFTQPIQQLNQEMTNKGLPIQLSCKESACQCRRLRKCGCAAWVRRSPRVGNGTPSSILAWKIPWT